MSLPNTLNCLASYDSVILFTSSAVAAQLPLSFDAPKRTRAFLRAAVFGLARARRAIKSFAGQSNHFRDSSTSSE
jgi:hypothetical protein